MSAHMIELPDDLVEWIRGGKQSLQPAMIARSGIRTAAQLIDTAIERPMVFGTCTLAVSVAEGTALVCRRWGGAVVQADGFCSQWRAA